MYFNGVAVLDGYDFRGSILKTIVGVKQESRHPAILIWIFCRKDHAEWNSCPTLLAESSMLETESAMMPGGSTRPVIQW